MNDTPAHKLVYETAVGMADAVFEEAMSRDNTMFRTMRERHPGKPTSFLRKRFVSALAPTLLGDARATLAQILATTTDEALKLRIYEALTLDNAVPGERHGTDYDLRHTHH